MRRRKGVSFKKPGEIYFPQMEGPKDYIPKFNPKPEIQFTPTYGPTNERPAYDYIPEKYQHIKSPILGTNLYEEIPKYAHHPFLNRRQQIARNEQRAQTSRMIERQRTNRTNEQMNKSFNSRQLPQSFIEPMDDDYSFSIFDSDNWSPFRTRTETDAFFDADLSDITEEIKPQSKLSRNYVEIRETHKERKPRASKKRIPPPPQVEERPQTPRKPIYLTPRNYKVRYPTRWQK